MSGSWTVQQAKHSEHGEFILTFLLSEFERVFGQDVMSNEDCIVYNEPSAACPMLVINTTPVRIRLSQPDYIYWSQTIYQLSHEMCHYAFRQRKGNKDFTLSWFEELICESVSLYALKYASEHWSACQLSKMNPTFFQNHKTYLAKELANPFTDEFKQCDAVEKLIEYEKQKVPENRRESQKAERNFIYGAILDNPMEMKCVLDYSRYLMSNGILIDFDRWIRDSPCNLLQKLKAIQPVRGEFI